MKILFLTQTNPYANLSYEDHLFRYSAPSDLPLLLLWQNTPSIIIGRAQNPWLECNLYQMEKDHIPLVRRQSGGGTVYHDLGNLNFTFIQSSQTFNKQKNLKWIIQKLQQLNIDCYASERNDIIAIKNNLHYKISGSAFRQTRDTSFHHGTLLIQSNIHALQKYLHHKINPNISASKGVKSIRSNVINVSDINPSLSVEKLLEHFSHHSDFQIIKQYPETLKDQINILESKTWRYGKTLPFIIQKDNLIYHIEKGYISRIESR